MLFTAFQLCDVFVVILMLHFVSVVSTSITLEMKVDCSSNCARCLIFTLMLLQVHLREIWLSYCIFYCLWRHY